MAIEESVRAGLETVFMPPIDTVVHDYDPKEAPTEEQLAAYTARCDEIIFGGLQRKAEENHKMILTLESGGGGIMSSEERAAKIAELNVPMIRTRYPHDDSDSEDVLALGPDGHVVLIDAGSR